MENSKQHLLLRTDILQKTVVGCPMHEECSLLWSILFLIHTKAFKKIDQEVI